MEYRAITKEDPKKDLTHWKYIKREKVNGKWRYYYDDSELRKFDKGVTETSRTRDNGNIIDTKTTYSQSDKLLDGRSKVTVSTGLLSGGRAESVNIKKSQGKLSRAQANAEKWIFDTFVDPRKQTKVKRDFQKKVDNAAKWVSGIFGGLSKKFGSH